NKVIHEAVVKGPDGKEYKAVVDTLRGDVLRIFGSNRYETGMKVADFLTELQGAEKFDHIVLTTGLNFPDALSGAYLANTLDAPILLIRGDATTTAAVQKYIKEHLSEDGEILVLGGANAVKEEWLGDLGKQFKVSRVAGDNRYLTNLDILDKVDYRGGDILVCTGLEYADSLSGSAVDMPILLVKDALTKEQTDYLSKIKGAKFHIVGGTSAVSAAVEKELAKYGEVVERFAGKNRYETSTLLAEAFFKDAKQAVLAYGVNFPDGLCGGVIAAKMGAPLIVTISDDRKSFAVDYCADRLIKSGVVLGGSGLIDDIAVRKIFNMNAKDEIVIYERE
ncbi:MAG: cell wall-binding repeat-containing protein, partial [Erysipelotrichaceae bacterium]|nr:cell wall-binding repeat-containing protein [Erysipelotrichaceae bacterium]